MNSFLQTGADRLCEMSSAGTADATTAGRFRRDLQQWLREVVAESAEVSDIVLGVNEALANCVEHAYRAHEQAGPMKLQVSFDRETRSLQISVSDHGTWRRPSSRSRSDARASRGISLMNALAEHCSIRVRPEGTTVHMHYVARHPRCN